jgi:hypothetical protein
MMKGQADRKATMKTIPSDRKAVICCPGVSLDDLIIVGFLDMEIRHLRKKLEEALEKRRRFPASLLQVISLPRKSKFGRPRRVTA